MPDEQAVDEKPDTGAAPRKRHRLTHRYHTFRDRVGERPWAARSLRIGIGVVGALVLALGIVAIPYPGPGWLIVFAGLAILATEFAWAGRLLHYARGKYDAWEAWLRRQSLPVRLAVLGLTGAIVLVTLWLLNVGGLVGGWFGIEWAWLRSPLGL